MIESNGFEDEIFAYTVLSFQKKLKEELDSKILTGHGAVPENFVPPTEEEKRRKEIAYASDTTRLGASRGGW